MIVGLGARRLLIGMLSAIIGAGVGGCARPVEKADLIGTYRVEYKLDRRIDLGSCTLVLKANGEYVQTYTPKAGSPVKKVDTWTLWDDGKSRPCVYLEDSLDPVSYQGRANSPIPTVNVFLPIVRFTGKPSLCTHPDYGWYYKKIR